MCEQLQVPTNKGDLSPVSIINELTYSSYFANRGYGMTAADLKKLFPVSGDAMEQRYQLEVCNDLL